MQGRGAGPDESSELHPKSCGSHGRILSSQEIWGFKRSLCGRRKREGVVGMGAGVGNPLREVDVIFSRELEHPKLSIWGRTATYTLKNHGF